MRSLFRMRAPHCPHFDSVNVQCNISHPRMTHRCRVCPKKPMFTVRTGTVMECTKMDYRTWAIGIHLTVTSLKGVSSRKLHRNLEVTQKSAWFMAHRLREAFTTGDNAFVGAVEVDECYIGGLERNKH